MVALGLALESGVGVGIGFCMFYVRCSAGRRMSVSIELAVRARAVGPGSGRDNSAVPLVHVLFEIYFRQYLKSSPLVRQSVFCNTSDISSIPTSQSRAVRADMSPICKI